MISFTKLIRYMENPARAYAWYRLGDKTAYDGTSPALIYGKIAHAAIAGEEPELTIEEQSAVYKYGDPAKGVKAAYATLPDAVELAKHIRTQLGLDDAKCEVTADNGKLMGRFDLATDNVILDWKFVTVKDFDHAWDDRTHSFGDWINSTHYATQALIYSIIHGELEHYYIVAIDKGTLNYRVYDLAAVQYNYGMIEELNNALNDVLAYESGEQPAAYVNDGSEWAIKQLNNRPLEVVEPALNGRI